MTPFPDQEGMDRNVQLSVREVGSGGARELYVTATAPAPVPGRPPGGAPGEAADVFSAVGREVDRRGGRICRERIFVPPGAEQAWSEAWASANGAREGADVASSWLCAGPEALGGVQAYAVAGPAEWTRLADDGGEFAGWAIQIGEARWVVTSGLCQPGGGDGLGTAQRAFLQAERLIAQGGLGLGDVARTWFFLDDILSWYGRFNAGRNQLFQDRGLLEPNGRRPPRVPASTGIGVSPAAMPRTGRPRLLAEFVAAGGVDGIVTRRPAAGRQRCACEYGSAFSRAASMRSPGGRTVFVSGTAAIDADGNTCFPGDAAGQIRMTMDNVTAVLGDMESSAGDVVEAMAYCKSPRIAAEFARDWRRRYPWPWVIAVGDVCREDLLFEAEVTACSAAGRPGPDASGPRRG